MSNDCRHDEESVWTGPTPEDVVKASGRRAILVSFTHRETGEQVLVRIQNAIMSIIWPHVATFHGRCIEGRTVERGIICAHPGHRGSIHIEFIHHSHALSLVEAS